MQPNKTESIQLEPGTIILFLDEKEKSKPDYTGYNQSGVVLDENRIIFLRNKKVIQIDADKLRGTECKIIKPKNNIQKGLLNFFNLNKINAPLLQLALYSFSVGNEKLFEKPVIMPILCDIDNDEHCKRWFALEKNIKRGDLVFTFQQNNFVSKFIASLDDGIWSHVGTYVGDGKICEAVSAGVVKRELNVYKKTNIRVGIYRLWDVPDEKIEKFIQLMQESVGRKYNYWGAIILGLKKILRIKNNIPTPNEIIVSGNLFLVCLV